MSSETPIDDLEVGQYVAVTGSKRPPMMLGDGSGVYTPAPEPHWHGKPALVLAISLPFIAVETASGKRGAIDVREHVVRRVTEEYADALWSRADEDDDDPGDSKIVTEPDRHLCPNCGAPELVQRLLGRGQWAQVCRKCGAIAEEAE